MNIKAWLFEMTEKGQDNVEHKSINDKVDLISVPIKENNLSDNEIPEILNKIKTELEFKGSIRLSNSGKSYNLYRNKLEKQANLVTLNVSAS